MTDRAGNPIRIAWTPKEIIWLKAALSLPAYECLCALDDIASMSSRTISAVKAKAQDLAAEADRSPARRLMVPARALAKSLPISELKQPSEAMKMRGRA